MTKYGWFVGVFLLVSCANKQEDLQKFAADAADRHETGREVTLIYSDSAIVKARIYAPLMIRKAGEKPETEMPDGIKALFFDADGQANSTLTANRAIQYPNEGIMEAHGNVVVVNEEGDTLYTEKLVWYEKEERISSDQYVRIVRPDEIIFGDGLESNQNFTRYRILNIRGTIALNDEIE
jgi:LPS export ABC transporter protein LptC